MNRESTQEFDLEGLKSSYYCPKEGKEYEKLMYNIEKLFEKHQNEGKIKFNYETKIYWC